MACFWHGMHAVTWLVTVTATALHICTRTEVYIKRFITILVDGLLPPLVLDGGDSQRGSSGRLPHLFRLQILVFHPNVLSQPLLRGCHIFTLVTLQFLGNSRIFTGNPSSRFLSLLGNELLSPPGISPTSWGTCHLLGSLACHCLAPGVQWEGKVRANWDGKVESSFVVEIQKLARTGINQRFLIVML